MKCLFASGYLYAIGVTVNPNVLLKGFETCECLGINEYQGLPDAFEKEMLSIFGSDIFDYLPRYGRGWECGSICYSMDVPVLDIELILSLLRKTDIPRKNTDAISIDGNYLSCFNSPLLLACDKAQLISQHKADYPGYDNEQSACESDNILRLMVQCPKSKLHTIRKQMRFEGLGVLDLINPVTAEEVLLKAWDKTVGRGDFYNYGSACDAVKSAGIVKRKENELLAFLDLLSECGSIPEARESVFEATGSKTSFNKKLKELRELGINGAFLSDDGGIARLDSPSRFLEDYFQLYTNA